MKRSRWLNAATATWQEVATFLKKHPAAILPLGATEQHGPHLPLATDTLLAEELARRVAQKSVGLVLPSLPFGYSWVWRDTPGTLTLSFDTFRAVIKDIARSLHRAGCQSFLILTAHGANVQPLKYTVRELADELPLRILHLMYPGLSQILRGTAESAMWLPGNFHAEEFETSLMLALHPDLVRMDKAVREYPPRSVLYEHSSLPMGALSQSGVFGDATVATPEKGAAWLEAAAEKMAEMWRDFLNGRE
jgi:creatinine amidohydrolase